LRASGMGFGYGVGNLGKIIGPAGLAVIVGSSNIVKPEASLDYMIPAMLFLAFWSALSGAAFLWGIETRGRSIEEIDRTLTAGAVAKPAMAKARAAAE
jgi:putative MFS transporter